MSPKLPSALFISRLRRSCTGGLACSTPVMLFAWLVTLPAPAWAYIDPNAGGLLYQILFPLIVAIGAAWAGLRHRIGYWWARLRGRQDEPEGPAPAASASAEEPGPRTGPQGPGGHG